MVVHRRAADQQDQDQSGTDEADGAERQHQQRHHEAVDQLADQLVGGAGRREAELGDLVPELEQVTQRGGVDRPAVGVEGADFPAQPFDERRLRGTGGGQRRLWRHVEIAAQRLQRFGEIAPRRAGDRRRAGCLADGGTRQDAAHQQAACIVERQHVARLAPLRVDVGTMERQADSGEGHDAADHADDAGEGGPQDAARSECKARLTGKGSQQVDEVRHLRPREFARCHHQLRCLAVVLAARFPRDVPVPSSSSLGARIKSVGGRAIGGCRPCRSRASPWPWARSRPSCWRRPVSPPPGAAAPAAPACSRIQ